MADTTSYDYSLDPPQPDPSPTEMPTEDPPEPDLPSTGASLGTVLAGVILLLLGALWLLDSTGVLAVTWTITSAVMLIVVGAALILGARRGSHGGLMFLGFVLTVVVLLGTLVSWPGFSGDVGDSQFRPTSIEDVEASYNWGIGSQLIDLRDVEFPQEETEISIRLGTGDVEVRFPEDVAHRVHWQVGLGNVQVFERQHSGFGLNGTEESPDYDEREQKVSLDIQVGLGAIEVLR